MSVPESIPAPLRPMLRHDLTAAIKARDAVAVAAVRALLAAIDDAEAAAPGRADPDDASEHVAGASAGIGRSEVARNALTDAALGALVRAEVAQWRSSAQEYADLGRVDAAARLRAQADVAARYAGPP
ncbi:hypothetical protein [Pengzhenrongella sicca]|uniref:Uncharacterized protein n=1 Tax=Pengzhenrongella sicca TaxID=2819238 RepID=A0A8A4Z7H6_9MICO|nr:hypothetical protein [Pengzhenrongella sicca]QTE27792.1 hypothetical protein J4E96_10140 [Pengzhenrongella sicca]